MERAERDVQARDRDASKRDMGDGIDPEES
jgi:hypothetical protein